MASLFVAPVAPLAVARSLAVATHATCAVRPANRQAAPSIGAARFQLASKARFGAAIRSLRLGNAAASVVRAVPAVASYEPETVEEAQSFGSTLADKAAHLAAGITILLATTPFPALAAEEAKVEPPVFTPLLKGPLEFVHPILMYGLFGASLYAGYLGWKVRQTRSASGEEKKALVKGKYSERHTKLGSIIMGAMVTGTAWGMLVTYNNNAKLYPGSHLYSGVLMAALIASAGALVPWMREGKEWARNAHIALNSAMCLLFLSEVATGTEIVQFLLGLK